MKSKIFLAIAIVAVLVGLYGVAGSLVNKPHAKTQENTHIQVWQLKENAHSGEIVNRRILSVKQLPKAKANQLGFTENVNLKWAQGAVFRQNLTQGSYISNADIVQPSDAGYIDYVIKENRVAFPVEIDPNTVIGGVLTNGSKVDVLSVIGAKKSSSGFSGSNGKPNNSVYVKPIFSGIKVLQVKKQNKKSNIEDSKKSKNHVVVVLELTRKQAVTLTVAEQVSQIKLDKSVGEYSKADLQADSGDILPHFQGVAEYRADKMQIN